MANPIGANFTIANGTSGQPTGDWNAELAAGFEGGSVSGYFAADWYGPLLRQTAPFSTVAQLASCLVVPLSGSLASRRTQQRKNGGKVSKNT